MALTSANICSSLRKMPIIDDDVIRMCPSDIIGCDNRGTKGIILGQLVLIRPGRRFAAAVARPLYIYIYIYIYTCEP